MSRPFLLEIGMEECPARFVGPALDELTREMRARLREDRIIHGDMRTMGTPRRLTLLVDDVAEHQAPMSKEVKGPPARAAFDERGGPTRAAEGFARSQGVGLDDLEVRETPQGEYVFAVQQTQGEQSGEVLQQIVPELIGRLHFPKSMQWGDGTLRFARPIRWIVALFGEDIVPFALGDVASGRTSRGHRFLSSGPVTIDSPAAYEHALEAAYVIADIDRRRSMIERQVKRAAEECGGEAMVESALLAEVTCLVEYPTAVCGRFDDAYLSLPEAVLITPMREHQKYFPVRSEDGGLSAHFIAVRNGDERGLDTVRQGNERVLAARFADARFFYEEDLKRPLESYVDQLRDVVYQERLGTVYEKVERLVRLVDRVAERVDAPAQARKAALRAARLCKADLVTHMVDEFPELQGVMGAAYAQASGESDDVAAAIAEHHLPRHAADRLPQSTAGALVSLADKLDAIAGYFGIGKVPTGSQDPYALRRHALGLLHILLDRRWPLPLNDLVDLAFAQYGERIETGQAVRTQILDFLAARLRGILVDEGIRGDLVDAALAADDADVPGRRARALALQEAWGTAAMDDLLVAHERVSGLASKADPNGTVDEDRLAEAAERDLWQAFRATQSEVAAASRDSAHDTVIRCLAALRQPIDRFFAEVLVMADDAAVRANRLSLLAAIAQLMRSIGDLQHVRSAG